MSEIINTINGVNGRLDIAEKNNKPEDTEIGTIQNETHREKRNKK